MPKAGISELGPEAWAGACQGKSWESARAERPAGVSTGSMNEWLQFTEPSLWTKRWGISQQHEKQDALSATPLAQVGRLRLGEVTSTACGHVEAKGQARIRTTLCDPGAHLLPRCLSSPATPLRYKQRWREAARNRASARVFFFTSTRTCKGC